MRNARRWEPRWEWPPGRHMPPGRQWPNRRHPKSAAGMAVVTGIVQVAAARSATVDPDTIGYALLLAGPLALPWRYRFPVPVLAVAVAATAGYAAWAVEPSGPYFFAALVALFAAIGAGARAAAWGLALAGYAGYVVATRPDLRQGALVAVALAVAILLAEASRVRRQQFAEIAKYRAEQARARAEQERRQASEERLRIARELHDVLGHHLSLINVQAGVGLHLMDTRPEQARAALAAIKSASAEALREVRSVLGVLRPEEEAAPRAPAPGLARLDELTAGAGLPVSTVVDGAARPLPAEVDRAAYRIVQEALTNVRRHAGPGAAAVVTIAYADHAVTVEVTDDGTAQAAVDEDAGNGIAGMRARAEALGGTLTAAPAPEGGFHVAATLPILQMSSDKPGESGRQVQDRRGGA